MRVPGSHCAAMPGTVQRARVGAASASLDPSTAIRWHPGMADNSARALRAQAEAGDAQSQFLLSKQCFSEGDVQGMVDWLERAAGNGLTAAMDALGYCFEKGMGVERDYARAFGHYEQAAEHGSMQAAYRLAELRYKSREAAQQLDAVLAHLNRALEEGYLLAQRAAGFLLMQAAGAVPEAIGHLSAAARQGDPVSQFNLACCLASRAPEDARYWLSQAAEVDYPLVATARQRIDTGTAIVAEGAVDSDAKLGEAALQPAVPKALSWHSHSEDPAVRVAHGALDLPERAYLIHVASPFMQRARVITPDAGDPGSARDGMHSKVRTGDSTFLAFPLVDLITHYIESKIAVITDMDIRRSEPFSVLRYRAGEYYQPHYDYFDPELTVTEQLLRDGGQRVASAIAFLNDVERGGGTAFPELGLEVPAHGGDILFFRNCHPDGSIDPRSLHAGTPVKKGTKWVATKWFREGETSYVAI